MKDETISTINEKLVDYDLIAKKLALCTDDNNNLKAHYVKLETDLARTKEEFEDCIKNYENAMEELQSLGDNMLELRQLRLK